MPRLTPLAVLIPALMAMATGVAAAADTGDAPESYGAATHEIVPGAPLLGKIAPTDDAPSGAVGVDADASDDGVPEFRVLAESAKAYTVDVYAGNPGTVPATLVGWIDFDRDGRFDADEGATDTVPAGTDEIRIRLRWTDLRVRGVTIDGSGATYARFRVSTDPLGVGDASGAAADGEVEDYTVEIVTDADGDGMPDAIDTDDDNDGIPDEVEVIGTDTDGDGTPDSLDLDSDGDGVPDAVEAGENPGVPRDTDGDGTPDYLDTDSDNDGRPDGESVGDDADGDGIDDALEGEGDADGDGIPNAEDIDSDDDTIPDAIEVGDPSAPRDTDRDAVPDFLDLDSDNDGIPDLFEASGGEIDARSLDTDGDGRVDAGLASGLNGLVDVVESAPDSGVTAFAIDDADGDGVRNYIDRDSDDDAIPDVVEAGGTDDDANGIVDALRDIDDDGVPDAADVDLSGGADVDADGIDDAFDADLVGSPDSDGDGIVDSVDADVDGDGIVDGVRNALSEGGELPDTDADGIPDFRDADAIGGDGNGTVPGESGTGDGDEDGAGDGSDGPRDDASGGSRVETGLSGYGGCSIGASVSRDPLLPGIALASVLLIAGRRRAGGRTVRVRA